MGAFSSSWEDVTQAIEAHTASGPGLTYTGSARRQDEILPPLHVSWLSHTRADVDSVLASVSGGSRTQGI